MKKYIVNVSAGLASTEAMERTIEHVGKEYTVPVFADVKGISTEEHAGEDEDAYRFLADIEHYFGIEIIHIVEGRDIWQVMFDERAITLPVGKTRVAKCSIKLKREPIDAWIAARYTPDECIQVTGLGWQEPHRIEDFVRVKAPYQTWHPLSEAPYVDNCIIAAKWEARGIRVPHLYELGFPHDNCGGFCVKAGLANFALLYRVNRPRYMHHAAKEARFRAEINPKATILRLRRGGKVTPITMYEFAEMLDRGEGYDKDEWGGCGCFAPTRQERMDELLLQADVR
jgi:hypothetical protein